MACCAVNAEDSTAANRQSQRAKKLLAAAGFLNRVEFLKIFVQAAFDGGLVAGQVLNRIRSGGQGMTEYGFVPILLYRRYSV